MNKEQIEKLAKFKELRQAATNASFDCGEFDDDDAHEAYRALALKANDLNEQVDKFVEKILAEHSLSAQDEVLMDDDLTQEFTLDQITRGIRYDDSADGWEKELAEYIRVECNRAVAAAAPSPAVDVEPVEQHKRQVFMDEIDAATAGSEWLEPFFGPGFRLCYSVDEGAQAPRAKWCMLFDSLDRVVAGYMLTRDAKNWTELTKISAATPSPSLAVRDVVEMEDPIMIPRGLVGAACHLIRKHAPNSKLLEKLRDFTFDRHDKPNADCSGEPANCPDNEGYGCACDPMNKAVKG